MMRTGENNGIAGNSIVVILAAGKGTRMGRSDLGKVCFEIDSVPAINRIISVFKRQRFNRFLLVVGSKAQQVLDTVAKEHPGAMYVYQEPQLGTGHAAKVAAEALENLGYAGNVLVTMGDKLIEEEAVQTLVAGYVKQQADMALLTIPRTKATEGSAGRVVVDSDGQALDIIESADWARQRIVDELSEKLAGGHRLKGADIRKVINRHIGGPSKQEVAVGKLLALARQKRTVERAQLEGILKSDEYNLVIEGKRYSARQIEKVSKGGNPSLYLFRADVFYHGVGMIDNNNAQGEYYLTDVVRLLAGVPDAEGKRRFRIRTVPVEDPDWVQGAPGDSGLRPA